MDKVIMVVDDEALILKTLDTVLGRADYTVRCCSSGAEALDILKKEDIRVFLLDLKMPGMDGVELCREIKKLKPIACVYALTAHASDYHVDQSRKAGFDDYFLKPFSIEMILNACAEAFEKIADIYLRYADTLDVDLTEDDRWGYTRRGQSNWTPFQDEWTRRLQEMGKMPPGLPNQYGIAAA